jgi:hypothetical protein
MATKRAGQVQCKWLVRSNANKWASLCNYPAAEGIPFATPDNPKRELSHMPGDQHRFHFINNALIRM